MKRFGKTERRASAFGLVMWIVVNVAEVHGLPKVMRSG